MLDEFKNLPEEEKAKLNEEQLKKLEATGKEYEDMEKRWQGKLDKYAQQLEGSGDSNKQKALEELKSGEKTRVEKVDRIIDENEYNKAVDAIYKKMSPEEQKIMEELMKNNEKLRQVLTNTSLTGFEGSYPAAKILEDLEKSGITPANVGRLMLQIGYYHNISLLTAHPSKFDDSVLEQIRKAAGGEAGVEAKDSTKEGEKTPDDLEEAAKELEKAADKAADELDNELTVEAGKETKKMKIMHGYKTYFEKFKNDKLVLDVASGAVFEGVTAEQSLNFALYLKSGRSTLGSVEDWAKLPAEERKRIIDGFEYNNKAFNDIGRKEVEVEVQVMKKEEKPESGQDQTADKEVKKVKILEANKAIFDTFKDDKFVKEVIGGKKFVGIAESENLDFVLFLKNYQKEVGSMEEWLALSQEKKKVYLESYENMKKSLTESGKKLVDVEVVAEKTQELGEIGQDAVELAPKLADGELTIWDLWRLRKLYNKAEGWADGVKDEVVKMYEGVSGKRIELDPEKLINVLDKGFNKEEFAKMELPEIEKSAYKWLDELSDKAKQWGMSEEQFGDFLGLYRDVLATVSDGGMQGGDMKTIQLMLEAWKERLMDEGGNLKVSKEELKESCNSLLGLAGMLHNEPDIENKLVDNVGSVDYIVGIKELPVEDYGKWQRSDDFKKFLQREWLDFTGWENYDDQFLQQNYDIFRYEQEMIKRSQEERE